MTNFSTFTQFQSVLVLLGSKFWVGWFTSRCFSNVQEMGLTTRYGYLRTYLHTEDMTVFQLYICFRTHYIPNYLLVVAGKCLWSKVKIVEFWKIIQLLICKIGYGIGGDKGSNPYTVLISYTRENLEIYVDLVSALSWNTYYLTWDHV